MTDIISHFTDEYKAQSREYTSLLWRLATPLDSTPQERVERVRTLTEAYYGHTDTHADANVLKSLADVIIIDYLLDNRADKMSLVEYPILSDRQEERRQFRHCMVSDVTTEYQRENGKRTTSHEDEDGTVVSRKRYIVKPEDDSISQVETKVLVRDALDNAGLTAKQRQAIELVYYEEMTQEQAAEVMGIARQTLGEYLTVALRKLRKYLRLATIAPC